MEAKNASLSKIGRDNKIWKVYRTPSIWYHSFMRRINLAPGTFHHVILRGSRGMDIFCDKNDMWEALRAMHYLNDEYKSTNWKRDLVRSKVIKFERPNGWPERKPLINICAYCFHKNHIHILVKEIQEEGLSNFMRRFPKVLTVYYNKKYGGTGSIFQGPYKQRYIESNADLRNLSLYIMAKNVMERFPAGGINGALKNFEKAWMWANKDTFSSFAEYGSKRESPVVDKIALTGLWKKEKDFKTEVREYLVKKNFEMKQE